MPRLSLVQRSRNQTRKHKDAQGGPGDSPRGGFLWLTARLKGAITRQVPNLARGQLGQKYAGGGTYPFFCYSWPAPHAYPLTRAPTHPRSQDRVATVCCTLPLGARSLELSAHYVVLALGIRPRFGCLVFVLWSCPCFSATLTRFPLGLSIASRQSRSR